MSFFALPREIRDMIYAYTWSASPAIEQISTNDLHGRHSLVTCGPLTPSSWQGLPQWLLTHPDIMSEGTATFHRLGTLQVQAAREDNDVHPPILSHFMSAVLRPTEAQKLCMLFLISEVNIPVDNELSPVTTREVHSKTIASLTEIVSASTCLRELILIFKDVGASSWIPLNLSSLYKVFRIAAAQHKQLDKIVIAVKCSYHEKNPEYAMGKIGLKDIQDWAVDLCKDIPDQMKVLAQELGGGMVLEWRDDSMMCESETLVEFWELKWRFEFRRA